MKFIKLTALAIVLSTTALAASNENPDLPSKKIKQPVTTSLAGIHISSLNNEIAADVVFQHNYGGKIMLENSNSKNKDFKNQLDSENELSTSEKILLKKINDFKMPDIILKE